MYKLNEEITEKFLSYYPLKQGLKLSIAGIRNVQDVNFYPTIH